MKKLFALLAVFSLAAIGCNDTKTSNKPADKGSGTYVQTNKVDVTTHVTATQTKLVGTETVTHTETKVVTPVVTKTPEKAPEKPSLPPAGDGKSKTGGGN